MSTTVPKPFVIAVPDTDISILRGKLSNTRFPSELDEAGWQYGSPLDDIKRLVAYWRDGYDWRKHERQINASLPQFTIQIPVEGFETLNIHFIHKRSEVGNAIPLLFVHGWPGSFLEVAKILPLLTSTSHDEVPSFHVVTFSLPGYGFSQASKKKGFSVNQYAEVGHKLMQALGYKEYVTQGGDWGYLISRRIGQLYGGKHCKASHSNFSFGSPPELLKNPILYLQHTLTPYTRAEKAGLARTQWFLKKGHGYVGEQSTQPQTLGYSLDDSPVGLLAWIYEKLVNWTDNYPWTDDEILTWISIYWFSYEGPTASLRIYYEAEQTGDWNTAYQKISSNVLVGMSIFPKEIVVMPKSWMKNLAKIVFVKTHTSGGHLAAHEKPNELVDDLRAMFGRGGPAFGVVEGHTGYIGSIVKRGSRFKL